MRRRRGVERRACSARVPAACARPWASRASTMASPLDRPPFELRRGGAGARSCAAPDRDQPGRERPWRYCLAGSPYLSRAVPRARVSRTVMPGAGGDPGRRALGGDVAARRPARVRVRIPSRARAPRARSTDRPHQVGDDAVARSRQAQLHLRVGGGTPCARRLLAATSPAALRARRLVADRPLRAAGRQGTRPR